jgi:hypothetical protein
MVNKTKRIEIRATEKELSQIDQLAAKAKMNRSEYIIAATIGKRITVVEGGKEVAHQLSKVGTNINQLIILAHQGKIKIVYLDKFAEEVNAAWRSLNLSINQTEHTPE